MKQKALVIVVVLLTVLATTLPALADAPAEGTVYEGVSVPDIALGDTRAQVEALNGPSRSCKDVNEPNDLGFCSFDVEGGGGVGVYYRGPNGGYASGSPDDVAIEIDWSEVDGWVTTAGVSTTLAYNDKQAVIDAYPNAFLEYNSLGTLIRLTDPELGIEVFWNHAYIFYSVTMIIYTPFTPPPPPELMRVADIEMSYNRRSVTAKVLVVDEQGQPVEGAIVGGYWVYPINKNNNTTLYIEGITAGDGNAIFHIDKARPGDYRINIEYITKEGYEFDYDNSIILGTITKPK